MTAPVRRQVLVNAAPQRAFDLFVGRINAWWPLDEFGVFNDGTITFERELLVERSGDKSSVWGEVTEWVPPSVITLTWHPGYEADAGTNIRVTFEAHADQTLVTLLHSGWERMSDPDASAEEYGDGWPGVLARYVELVDEVH